MKVNENDAALLVALFDRSKNGKISMEDFLFQFIGMD